MMNGKTIYDNTNGIFYDDIAETVRYIRVYRKEIKWLQEKVDKMTTRQEEIKANPNKYKGYGRIEIAIRYIKGILPVYHGKTEHELWYKHDLHKWPYTTPAGLFCSDTLDCSSSIVLFAPDEIAAMITVKQSKVDEWMAYLAELGITIDKDV